MKITDSFTASFSKSSFESAMSNIGQFAGRVISYISERSSTSTVGAIFFASSVLSYLAYRSCYCSNNVSSSRDTTSLLPFSSDKDAAEPRKIIANSEQPTVLDKDSEAVFEGEHLCINFGVHGKKTVGEYLDQYDRIDAKCVMLYGKNANGQEKTKEEMVNEIKEIARNIEKFPDSFRIRISETALRSISTSSDSSFEDPELRSIVQPLFKKNVIVSEFYIFVVR